jgi:hypothetical protein
VARCNALREEGISAYHWCGSYRLPVQTITGDVQVQLLVSADSHWQVSYCQNTGSGRLHVHKQGRCHLFKCSEYRHGPVSSSLHKC